VIKIRPGSYMAEDGEPTNRRALLDSLQANEVQQITDHKLEKITSDGVEIVSRESGQSLGIEADVIVLALGSKPERGLAETLENEGIEFKMIGDCSKPKNIKQAVYEGFHTGYEI